LKAQVDKEASDVKTLRSADLGEQMRAISAESALGVRIDQELKRAGDVETDLYAKTVQLTGADTLFSAQLATETKERQDADLVLEGKIQFEKDRAKAAENLINERLTLETIRATEQDFTHTADIAAETARAVERENTLMAVIAAESSNREFFDQKLTTDLNTEITNRIAGVNAVTSDLKTKYEAIDTAFGNFVAVATSRDEYLNQKCDFIMKNVDPAAIDSLSELVNRQNSVALGVYSRLQMLEDIVSTLIGRAIYDPGERPETLPPMVGPTMDPVSPPPAAMS
jgi:hypothetical protein